MKKLLLIFCMFTVFSHGMEFPDIIPNPNFKITYTLKGVSKDIFTLEQVGAKMTLDGIVASSIYLFYDDYHGLKMFSPLAVSVFDSRDEIINALWRSFHKKGMAQLPEESSSTETTNTPQTASPLL